MSSELTSALGSIAQSMGADKFIIEKTNELIDTKFREPNLVASIEGLLKEKYGEDSFYNDLTAHINNHNIITKLINMFYSIGTSDIASKERFVQECLNSFCKDYSISPYEHSSVRKCYELIYDEVYKKIIVLNPHTNLGKIQTSISIAGSQNHNEHTAQMDVLTKILQNTSLLVQNQNAMSVPSKEDLGPISEAITVFLKKIDSVGSQEHSVVDDNEAILKYQELLGEAFVTLREENPKQLDMVICSLECHLAIRYSNLGKVEKAFDCLDKISHEAAYNSKTYHYVKSAIIVNNGIKDRYDEANVNINKALELDKTYHRAFLVSMHLSALQNSISFEEILNNLDLRFKSILLENKDCSLIADYYMYRGFVCKEFKEYKLAEEAFLSAKNQGYEPLISDFNLGLLYYDWATDNLPKDERIFGKKIDTPLLIKVIKLFEEWLLGKCMESIPLYIKSRMVGIYVSSCGLLGIKHGLHPISEYIKLPDIKYEVLRIIILGADYIVEDENLDLLNEDDRQYVKMINCLNKNNYAGLQNILSLLDENKIKLLPIPTIFLILQASVINNDLEIYNKFRQFIKETDNVGLIDCIDAYALEKKGEVELAKKILDRYSTNAEDYNLLRNILNFYARNNYDDECEQLFLRLRELASSDKIVIYDKTDFYSFAINYFIEHKSMHAKLFVDDVDFENNHILKMKANFYSEVNDLPNLLDSLQWLCENEPSFQSSYNKIICLLKLSRYETALYEAQELIETIHKNNIKDRTLITWLISNLYLFLGQDNESFLWAQKAHELNKDNPTNESHKFYLARSTRTSHIDDSLSSVLEYNTLHPVITSEWLKKVEFPKENSSEAFIKALDEVIGESHDDYIQNEKDFSILYRKNNLLPNSLILKRHGNNISNIFIFAENNKLRISSGDVSTIEEKKKLVGKHIIVDAITLIVLQKYDCLEALNEIENIHICYSTIETLQEYFLSLDAGHVIDLLKWIDSKNNIIWESDGYSYDLQISKVFNQEYINCCRISSEKQIPLLTIEPCIEEYCKMEGNQNFSDVKAVSIVTLCYATMSKYPYKFSQMLYNLLGHCTFINFNAETIFEQIKANDFVVRVDALSRFFICNSSCDMLSFAKVYIGVIKKLLMEHYNEAIEFSVLVLNDALKIWKKGQYYRYASRRFGDKESTIKSSYIIRYLVYVVCFIYQIYNNSLPEQLKSISHTIIKNIVGEYGEKFLNDILDSLQLTKYPDIKE